ncbi:type II toxin-antitoxin system Phd/YefM family antitoxin [bacterium]|nr:MAG: type II toxin-antitoxin system Phd/YefM family antitoxin [bacterium]
MTTKTIHSRAGAHRAIPWPVAEAKARLSELIERAVTDGPQIITRKGRPAVVVVSTEEWERKSKRRGTLAEFFAASPLRGADIQIERATDTPREIDL